MFTKFKHILAINFLCSLGTLNYQLFVINPHLKQLSVENKQIMQEFTDLRKVISKYHK